jgi:RNA polymerase sigma-70 factor (ECF subfamily)
MPQERAPEPEQRLIEAAQRDPVRFAELYEMHFDRVYAFIARRVRDRGEAEDLTSEVFHRALANLARFEWRGTPFAAWLYRIAHNAIAGRRQPMPSASSLPDPVDPGAPPETEIADAERRARLFRSVDALPVDQRRVILLRFAHDKSFREIAEELGRTEGAVKQLQVRALENLRARMEEARG